MNNTALYVIGAGAAGYVAAHATAEPGSAHVLGAAAAAGGVLLGAPSLSPLPLGAGVFAGLGTGLAVGAVTKDVGASVGAGLLAGIATAILFVVGESYRSTP